jgi:poly(A) polymerase
MEKQAATKVMDTLHAAGYEAFLVGGCVRDMVLGREPKDYDVTTDALPLQVQALFSKTLPIGASFGVIRVVIDDVTIEVATYRADGKYTDGRRPDEVHYSASAKDDVTRRDFTINGMLYGMESVSVSSKVDVVDYVGGMDDIRSRTIRCIGDAETRFTEDSLRMLRAVRFAAQLGFRIEDKTFAAIKKMASTISRVSVERIYQELIKLVSAPYASQGVSLLITSGLAQHIFGTAFIQEPLGITLLRFEDCPHPDPIKGLAMLFAEQKFARIMLQDLKMSTHEFEEVVGAVEVSKDQNVILASCSIATKAQKCRMTRKKGFYLGLMLLEQEVGFKFTDKKDVQVTAAYKSIVEFRALTYADRFPKLFVTGFDLIDMGMKPGPKFKSLLASLEDAQMEGFVTSKEGALAWIESEGKKYETR